MRLGVMLCWFLLPLTNISRICSGDVGWEKWAQRSAPQTWHPDTPTQPQAPGLRHPAALQAL